MSVKSYIMGKLGYQRRISKYKFLNSFDAQKKLLENTEHLTIFDVGAHQGETTAGYRQTFPKAIIHSFEPFGPSFEILKKRFGHDASVVCHQLAFADIEGRCTFHINQGSATNSLLPADEEGQRWSPQGVMAPIQTDQVPTRTIDQFCHDEKIRKIELLKLDTQGCELRVLQGAREALKDKRIDLIYAEMLFVPLYKGQAYFHDISTFLNNYQYRLYDLFGCRYAENGQLKWADGIFIPA